DGGPISLSPGQGASTSPNTALPIAPPTSDVTPASAPASAAARPARAGTVTWAQRPSARRYSEVYPSRAAREGVGGRVQLDCSVLANQSMACAVASESPVDMGFGRAALSLS